MGVDLMGNGRTTVAAHLNGGGYVSAELQNRVSWWPWDNLYEVTHEKMVAAVDVRWV